MRLLYVNSPHYDYTTAMLTEGLIALGHDVRCTETSNYGQGLPEQDIISFAESADLVIIGSNVGVRYELVKNMSNSRVVSVDGNDASFHETPKQLFRYKAIFKRELCKSDRYAQEDFVYPLPFAAEKRYFINTNSLSKEYLVSFIANMRTNPLRNSLHFRLLKRNNEKIITGWTNECGYSVRNPRPYPIETPHYRQLLANSRMSINVPGAGYDCARYWEIPALKTMLFTYEPDILIPEPFTDGVNCVTFSSLAEFDRKLDYYLARMPLVAEIAERGYEHLLAYHTSTGRAAYFLELATAAVRRTGHCVRFFKDSGNIGEEK